MKILTSSIAAALLLASTLTQAHSHLQSSKPAEGSTVSASPTAIELNFSEAVTLTALTIQKGDEKGQPLGPVSDKPTEKFSVSVPTLAPGKYVVSYRAVSDDNHVMNGKLKFTVSADKAAAMDHSKMPNMDHSKMPDHH